MARPQIHIKPDPFDWILQIVGILALVALIGTSVYHYSSLPETIPSHFGLNGEPDRYSKKEIIWVMSFIAVLTYLALSYSIKYPHIYNYPVKITKDNAERQYRIATKMMRVLNTLIALFLAYLTHSGIQIALGQRETLIPYGTVLFLLILFGCIGFSLWQAFRN